VNVANTDYVEPKPAPGPLRLVQEFVNTRDMDYSIEDLPNPEALTAWLRKASLLEDSAEASAADFEKAISIREALRSLLWAHNGGEAEQRTLQDLDQLADSCPHRVRFDATGEARVAVRAAAVEEALGGLFGVVLYAQAAGTWERLKACANPTCRWIFYDGSKNRVGRWCRMSMCGNRAKSKAHRERRKNASVR